MSFRALVIQEDPSQNGYILRPLLQAVLAAAGKPRAAVELLRDPRTRGYDDALAAIRGDLVERWRWMDVWIFVPAPGGRSRSRPGDWIREPSASSASHCSCPSPRRRCRAPSLEMMTSKCKII